MPETGVDPMTVRLGRLLAFFAMVVVPVLITWFGRATQRPVDVTLTAVLLWGSGTLLWLHFVWAKLVPAPPSEDLRHRRP